MWEELRLINVSKTFRSSRAEFCALDGLNLTIEKGGFYCLLGPSGCGKTTVLNIIAGFVKADSGTVAFDDNPIKFPGTDRAVIFQDVSNALFPWLTSIENVEFGLKIKGWNKNKRQKIAKEYLKMVGLDQDWGKFPYELSGGMKQRVQIARALANEPEVLLMDEPFAALDAITKKMLQKELIRLWRETKKTILYITHDLIESIILANRIGVMTCGPRAKIKKEFVVNLTEPKSPSNEDFAHLHEQMEAIIEEEVVKARYYV